jgi:hypothetical protein
MHGARHLRPRRHHDRADVEPRGARGLDGEQRVVDRAQPGARCDDDRQAEVERQVAHGVPERERDEQAADALGDEDLAGQRAGRRDERRGLERRARELGGEVRRDGRAEAPRGDLVGRPPRRGGEQLVVGRASGLGLVDPGDDRLERGDVDAFGAQRGGQGRRQDGLADPRVGAGDEEPARG